MAADLDLDLLLRDDRTLTLTVDGDRLVFPLPGLPTVTEMILLMRRERELLDAFQAEDADAIETTAAAALDLIHDQICRLTPDAPRLELNTPQIITTFRFLAGDDSVADAVRRTLTGGRDDEALTDEERAADAAAAGEIPLPSTRP
jgi:hypothetical protein